MRASLTRPLSKTSSSDDNPGPMEGKLDPSGGRTDRDVLASLYGEIRSRAERMVRGQPRDLTLQATALVHEACLKLIGANDLGRLDRTHCLALASRAMRSVLVDHARARGRLKRAPNGQRVAIDELQAAFEERAGDLVALDAALAKLEALDPLMTRLVDIHFFGGLPLPEASRALDVPLRTLERRWQATRVWLKAEIEGGR